MDGWDDETDFQTTEIHVIIIVSSYFNTKQVLLWLDLLKLFLCLNLVYFAFIIVTMTADVWHRIRTYWADNVMELGPTT